MENYIKSVYYNAYPLNLYFQVQFITVHCTVNDKTKFAGKATKRFECKKKKKKEEKCNWYIKMQIHENPEKK